MQSIAKGNEELLVLRFYNEIPSRPKENDMGIYREGQKLKEAVDISNNIFAKLSAKVHLHS